MGFRIRDIIKRDGIAFLKDVMFFYTFIILFIKSVVFVGFVYGSRPDKFNVEQALNHIPSLIVYAVFIGILISFSFFLKGRAHMWFLCGLNLCVSILLIFDLWYLRGFGNLLNFYILKQIANLNNMSESILSMFRTIDLIFICDAVVLPIILFFIKAPYRKLNRSIILFSIIFILSCGLLTFEYYEMDVAANSPGHLFKLYWAPKVTITNLSPLGYHMYDFYNLCKDSITSGISNSQKKEIEAWFKEKKENLPDNEYKAMLEGKNLILIQVESIEKFVINQKIEGQEITPNINGILKNSLYFSNIYEQVNNGTSSDSDLLVNTSVYPVRAGSTFFRFPGNTYNSLPKMMKKKGYSTLAMYPMKGSFWNWMDATKSIGFQNCLDITNYTYDEGIGLGISDSSFLRQSTDKILEQKRPFYAFMITLTSHGPFDIPNSYRELKLDKNLDKTKLGGYFQSIRYTDEQIGKMLQRLKEKGILKDSVVVIYGDHCGIHKYYQDELYSIKPSEDWWLEKDRCIPLIIYSDGIQGKEIKTIGGQIDILPTVAYLMGIKESSYEATALGRNLLKTNKSFAVLADKTYIGDSNAQEEKSHASKGVDIADIIIRGNYFKGKVK